MSITTIEWTDHSINPFRAKDAEGHVGHYCQKISAGCTNCYASKMQSRFKMPNYDVRNKGKVELFLDFKKMVEVLRRKKPTKYFWCDMTDMFLEDYPSQWIFDCFVVMALTPQHTHQILTKRPERMKSFMEYLLANAAEFRSAVLVNALRLSLKNRDDFRGGLELPLKNVWLGVSVEDQKVADERIPLLLETPAAVRWISAEPLLGPIDLSKIHHPGTFVADFTIDIRAIKFLDWVVVGGESGPRARPIHPDWARSLRDQCVSARVPFFFKQWGTWQPFSTTDGMQQPPFGGYNAIGIEDSSGGVFYANFLRKGKTGSGRILDGRTWDEYPN